MAAGEEDAIYVLDELDLEPGKLQAFLNALESGYRPGAEARGQTLLHTWVAPPTHTPDVAHHVTLVWKLDGLPGFWRMRSQNATAEVLDWWAEVNEFIRHRTRRFSVEASAVERFDALGKLHA